MKYFLILIILVAGVSGCKKAEEIVSHRIPKSRSDLDKFDRNPVMQAMGQNASQTVSSRMVVGLVERPDATWFFKINGPVDQVNQTEPVWREFLGNLKFAADGNPEWELPKGWSTGAARSMRFATLVMNEANPPLEMSISSLGPNQNLLANVNRWRGQLGLAPASKDELKLAEVSYGGGKIKLFDEAGTTAGGGGMGMGPMQRPAAQTPEPTIEFEPMAGWETGPSSSIVKVRMLKTEGEKKAQASVVVLPADANEWGANVQRWAREIGLSDMGGPEIAVRTSTKTIDGIEGQMLRLIEDDEKIDKATIAIMAKRDGTAWFFKISGDKSIVEAAEPEFEKFLASFKFEQTN